jgi:hypothetical protein
MLEELLADLAPQGQIAFLGHSIGALVASNVIAESPSIAARTIAVFMLDGSDARLLKVARESPPSAGQFRQMNAQTILASVLGLNRWTPDKIERDVEYRPDIQRSYLVTIAGVRTLTTAQREYFAEPLEGQESLVDLGLSLHVLAAADNIEQQKRLGERLGASFEVIEGGAHRSIIGNLACARAVARYVEGALR